jgi:hypothetical protein
MDDFEGDKMSNIPTSPMYVYSKQVKDNSVESDILNRKIDKEQVCTVIASLKEIGKHKKLEEFELRDNCKQWVCDILSGFSNDKKTLLKYLLNDFTDSMMTRMREKDKFALAIVFKQSILLCHTSIGEQTITPLWKVVDRMLDKDNVERFVFFQKRKGVTEVVYYEHTPSEFFTRWLGIPEKEAFFYLGGKNRFYLDIDGVKCVLELTDDDVANKFLVNASVFTIEKNQLIFSSPIRRLEIGQIRVGKKRYNSIADFLQDFLARKYELSYYQNAYRKLEGSLDVLSHAYFDDSEKVVAFSSDGEQVKVKKSNPNFHILFAGKLSFGPVMEMRASFFDRIFTNFINGIDIRIFHAGMKMYPQSEGPFQIGTLEIFNKIESNTIIKDLLDFIHKTEITDSTLKNALYYSVFSLLSYTNETKPISYVFNKFVNELGNNIHKSNLIVQNENETIEFKSRDYLVGKDEDVSKRISEDVENKIKSHPFKIYFFGIEDKTKETDPLPSTKFSSDRIGSLENRISKELSNKASVNMLKVPLDASNECLLMMFVIKDEQQ